MIRWWRRHRDRKRNVGVKLPEVDRQWIAQMQSMQDEQPTTYLWGEST